MFGMSRFATNFKGQWISNDPHYNSVVLLLRGETATDSSKNLYTLTPSSGDARVSTAQWKYGASSLNFINRGRYTIVGSKGQSNFNFGTADYTVDFWLRVVAKSDGNFVFGMGDWTKTNGNRWWLNYNSATEWKFLREGNASSFPGSGAVTINLNQWYHVALVRSSGGLKLYQGGNLLWNVGTDTTAYAYNNYDFTIGNDLGGTTFDNNHFIDMLRVTKGVARYTANFTPPTENDY